ncbi:flavodoxin-dependent (E)-4-hydroxy-3-methylbut-2-enyl-diphosphate synthase [Chloroflexota bacterium]
MQEVEQRLQGVTKSVIIVVVGCVVNGLDEARDTDVGIACCRGWGVIFKKGEQVRTVEEGKSPEALMAEADKV